jgi:hypothetical protein
VLLKFSSAESFFTAVLHVTSGTTDIRGKLVDHWKSATAITDIQETGLSVPADSLIMTCSNSPL